ncbi:MAG: segregation/condensation protein A [Syntrophomonadaceae bacterium]|jgi:segregation and condensation protein A|nr:segregation/condensation protein A [Syntrophomonadaceae bacterium]
MTYVVDLDAFHGPLDLLLYLIDRNEVDIYDIPIASITEQYLQHLQLTGDFNLENLGSFLSMASYLLNMKSRLLLPSYDDEGGEEQGVDLREELVKKLLEYRRYKKAAEFLRSRQNEEWFQVFYRTAAEPIPGKSELRVELKALIRAYQKVLTAIPEERAELFALPEGDINIERKMEEILERLQLSSGEIVFQDLFIGISRKREMMALFLALLELIRLQKVRAEQENPLAQIKVFLQVEI